MSGSETGLFPKEDFAKFQIQKIYIRNLGFDRSPFEWEEVLFTYFSHFGLIIDLKVLETSVVNSYKRALRLCHI